MNPVQETIATYKNRLKAKKLNIKLRRSDQKVGMLAAMVALVLGMALNPLSAATTDTWIGNGTSGATTTSGFLWTDLANYTTGGVAPGSAFSTTTNLDFSQVSTSSNVVFSAAAGTYAVGSLQFGTTTSGANAQNINFNGNGTAGGTTLGITGNITSPSTGSSIVTLGSDLTLNLTNNIHQINFAANPTVLAVPTTKPVLVINSLITGGGSAASLLFLYGTYGANSSFQGIPNLVLTNNSNSFDGAYTNVSLSYTSIGNIGTGNHSSLGAPSTVANSLITLGNGNNLTYVGSGNQSSNRSINYGGTSDSINNYATTPSTLTFNGVFTAATSAGTGALNFGVSTGNKTVIATVISDKSATITQKVVKVGSSSYYNASGVLATADGNGTLILSGANTYTQGTTVSAGILLVANTTGSGTGTGGVLVNAGGTFGGNGIVATTGANNITVANGAFLSPGGVDTATGTLTLDGLNATGNVLTMNSGAKFAFDLGSSNASDQIDFLNYTVGDLTLNSNTIAISNAQGGQFVLFKFYADGGTTLVNSGLNWSSLNFTGLTAGTYTLDTTSIAGEVILNVVPEPETYALLAVAGVCFFARRRKALALV